MENVVSLDNARLLDNYKKILDEKKQSDERTITELRKNARKRVSDDISVKNLGDLRGLFKDLSPLKYTFPEVYEQEKNILLPLICASINIKDTPKARSDILNEIDKIEKSLSEEVGPILGISEQDLSAVELIRNRYALDYTNKRVIDLDEMGAHTNLDGFKLLHSDRRVQDGKRDASVPEYILKYSLLKCVDGYTNDPQLPAPLVIRANTIKTTYTYNNWKGFRSEVTDALPMDSPDKHCRAILNHIWTYSVNKNKDQFDTSLNFMAHMVQKPWEKPGWCIVYRGREGCGKDVIARTLGKMVHPTHWIEIGDHELKNVRETGWRKGKLLVNVTEFTGVTERTTPHIYQIIEASEARIREMYMDSYTSKCISRVIMTTNSENVVRAKMDTRRFFITDFNDILCMNHSDPPEAVAFKNNYFDTLYKEIGGKEMDVVGEGVVAFYQYLKSRDISKFDVKHPRLNTIAMEDLIESNESTLDVLINDLIMTGEIPDYNEISMMPPIVFNKNKENIILGPTLNDYYKNLCNRTWKEHGKVYPAPGVFSKHFIKALGLPWDGTKNNRPHYKIMTNNRLHYVLPSLDDLRKLYFKNNPTKKPPT